MANFGSFWIGQPLSKVEQTALSSFIYFGHSLTLFVYDMNLAVPKGVIKKDANLIMPESKVFKIQNSYGPFADMFRYKMIYDTGLIWTDTDSICLKDDWNFGEYLFGYEEPGRLANGILGMPKDSELTNLLIKNSLNYNKEKIVWSEIGPILVTKLAKKLDVLKYAQPPEVFYPIHFWQWKKIWDPEHKNEVLFKCKDSHTIQMWNQFLNREGINKNRFPKNSAINYFYNLFS
jgi:mannosyltransferase OCH1-like enzyme